EPRSAVERHQDRAHECGLEALKRVSPLTRFGEIEIESSFGGIGAIRNRSMIGAHRTHRSAARPRQYRRNQIVATAAEVKQFEHREAAPAFPGGLCTCVADVACADCSKGGEPQ